MRFSGRSEEGGSNYLGMSSDGVSIIEHTRVLFVQVDSAGLEQ